MFGVTVNLLLGIIAFKVVSTHGTNQHLICKTIADVFTDGSSAGGTQTTPRLLQGRPGKRRQSGVKGEPGISGLKGDKGDPGFVDPQNVEDVVEQKCTEANRELLGRIEKLEQAVMNLTSTVPGVVDKVPCKKGFSYNGKCYFAIIHGNRDTDTQEGRRLCAAEGATAANILSYDHENLTSNHVRSTTTVSGITELWLGMSYEHTTLRWSTGNKVPDGIAAAMIWWRGHPDSTSNFNKMMLAVGSSKFGIFNYRSNHNTNGVVCEK